MNFHGFCHGKTCSIRDMIMLIIYKMGNVDPFSIASHNVIASVKSTSTLLFKRMIYSWFTY